MKITRTWIMAACIGGLALVVADVPDARASAAAPRTPGGDKQRPTAVSVVIDGETLQGIKVAKLVAAVEVVPYRAGNTKGSTTTNVPGATKPAPVVLSGSGKMPKTLRDWWTAVTNKQADRRDVAVKVHGGSKRPIEHHVVNAFPSQLSVDPAANRWSLTLASDEIRFFQ